MLNSFPSVYYFDNSFRKSGYFQEKTIFFLFFLPRDPNAKARIQLRIRAFFAADYECGMDGANFMQII